MRRRAYLKPTKTQTVAALAAALLLFGSGFVLLGHTKIPSFAALSARSERFAEAPPTQGRLQTLVADPFFLLQWHLPSWPSSLLDRFPYSFDQDKPHLSRAREDEFFSWSDGSLPPQSLLPPMPSCTSHSPLTMGWPRLWEISGLSLSSKLSIDTWKGFVPLLVVDGPVDNKHPDLEHRKFDQESFSSIDDDSLARNDIQLAHGTHIATFLSGGLNGRGGQGILPGYPLRWFPIALESDGRSFRVESLAQTLSKVSAFLLQNRPKHYVLLLNFAYIDINSAARFQFDQLLTKHLSKIAKENVTIVLPSGNSLVGPGQTSSKIEPEDTIRSLPDVTGRVVTVGASDLCSRAAWFSRRPTPTNQMEIYAPGERIYAGFPSGDHGHFSGTSLAAAQVAAMLAVGNSLAPHVSPKILIDKMVKSTRPLSGTTATYGMPNVFTFWELVTGHEH
jgi:hypothetical protein